MPINKLRNALKKALTPPDDPLTPLEREEELEAVLDRSHTEPVVLFKHSLTCGISSMARREVLKLAQEHDVPVYEVVVQRARPLSNRIAERFAIRHESPQVLVFRDGQPVFHTSHGAIQTERLVGVLSTPTSS
ncbi:MAG: hypothetical protein KatS3mg044_0043 [Rhodothermaceae bacterium]|nr:MAG: bacillithiol system redox-active protein YtxJ [Bacteroidota bacterium]GIV61177.1 MAG: hypothetical protein KatS3mg044_0043 [Rhodothermaceae bacterium]